MLKGWFPAHCILRAATCKSTYHTCLFSAVPGPWRFSYNVFLYGFVLTRRSYLFRKEWVNLVVYSFCDHSAILFRGLCFLRLSGSGPGCPMCPVPRFLCLCLCRCLPKPSTMGLFALVSGSRFPAALLCSPHPHPREYLLHILYHPSRFGGNTPLPSPSCSVQTRTRAINCKLVTQAGLGL